MRGGRSDAANYGVMSLDEAAAAADGQLLDIRSLDVPVAAEYADLVSITHDLAFVANACERLCTEIAKPEIDSDPVITQALWTAALVTYARCFATGKRKVGLTSDDIALVPLEGQVVEWHKYLIDMRNKHIAHSVNPFEAVSVGAVVGSSGDVEAVGCLWMRHIAGDEVAVMQTGRLAFALLKLIEGRAQQKQLEVLQAAQALDSLKLVRLPIVRTVAPGSEDAYTARQ